jgi:outer membrane receptor protein involved in Fe transport
MPPTTWPELAAFVPGLAIDASSPTQPRIAIRGITTTDFGIGTDPAVGVYVDGVYAGRSGGEITQFNDIEHIEVLKGPRHPAWPQFGSGRHLDHHTQARRPFRSRNDGPRGQLQ